MEVNESQIARIACNSILFSTRDFIVRAFGGGRIAVEARPQLIQAQVNVIQPITLTNSKPAWFTESVEPGENEIPIWIRPGVINNKIADNWDSVFYVGVKTWFFAKAFLNQDLPELKVTTWEILTGTTETEYETPDYGEDGERPEYCIVLLGYAGFEEGVVNFGVGGISVIEHITGISKESGQVTNITRSLNYFRGTIQGGI